MAEMDIQRTFSATHTIGLLHYPGCLVSGLFAFAELLQAANARAGARRLRSHWINISASDASAPSCDAYVLPGFWAESQAGAGAVSETTPVLKWLQRLPEDTPLWSYCTGVQLVARSGRLDGRSATSTWWLEAPLRKEFPAVQWQFRQTLIEDRRMITAAGVNGHLPIAQHLIETVYGTQVLRDVVRLMVLPRPECPRPAMSGLELMDHDDPLIRRLRRWVERTPARKISVSLAAEHLRTSGRSLARHIQQRTGRSPAWLMRRLKLEQAADLLIYSERSIKQVSHELGYSDEPAFRRSFREAAAMPPASYRRRFSRQD